MREAALLILAAALEVSGDAFVRYGLKASHTAGRLTGFLLGGAVLCAYGVFVNLPRWDFGRLLGVYIALFFVVSQIVAIAVFHERLRPPTILGGLLIIAGGIVLTFFRSN